MNLKDDWISSTKTQYAIKSKTFLFLRVNFFGLQVENQ